MSGLNEDRDALTAEPRDIGLMLGSTGDEIGRMRLEFPYLISSRRVISKSPVLL